MKAPADELVERPEFTPVGRHKLDALLAQGWQISGYAIHKDGEQGLVTVGGFVGWWTIADRNATAAEARLAKYQETLAALADKVAFVVNHASMEDEAVLRLGLAVDTARSALAEQSP